MRKIFAVVLLLICLGAVCIANADAEYQSLDDSALLKLKSEIDLEVETRLGHLHPFNSGKYVVGRDIKPGHYTMYCIKTVDGRMNLDIYFVVDADDPAKDKTMTYEYLQDGDVFSFVLSDGEVLKISDLASGFLKMDEKPSWAP